MQINIKSGDYRPVYIKIKTAVLSLLASGRRLPARRSNLMFNGLGVPKFVCLCDKYAVLTSTKIVSLCVFSMRMASFFKKNSVS